MRRSFFILSIYWLLTACGGQPASAPYEEVEIQGRTMGTTYSVKLIRRPAELDASALSEELNVALTGINQSLSTYIPDSELSQFNQAPTGQPQSVSPVLLEVLQAARAVYEGSGGAFDPTIGPLVNLWGFGPDVAVGFPEDEAIQSAQRRVGFNALKLDVNESRVTKSRDLYVDLSAIAKGYAVDRLAEIIEAAGWQHYLVEIGGELRSAGLNAEDKPWRIAIEKPQPGLREVHAVVNVSGLGMATSGDYRNFFEKEGQRYSHTLDPRTGYPVNHSLVSVTVLAEDAMTADAWATAFMVLGIDGGYAVAEREGLAVWFIEVHDQKLVDKLTPKMQSYRLH